MLATTPRRRTVPGTVVVHLDVKVQTKITNRYRDVYFNFGDTSSLSGNGAGPDDVSVRAGFVEALSLTDIRDVFDAPIASSLPYVFSTGEETAVLSFENAPELLMDDSHVLELAPQDEEYDPLGEAVSTVLHLAECMLTVPLYQIDIDVYDF